MRIQCVGCDKGKRRRDVPNMLAPLLRARRPALIVVRCTSSFATVYEGGLGGQRPELDESNGRRL